MAVRIEGAAVDLGCGGPHADQAPIEALEAELLLEALAQVHGADFRGFARDLVLDKLRAYLRQTGTATLSLLQDRILRSGEEAQALASALHRRSATLFEDTAGMCALREAIGPYLRSCPLPRIWVAEPACAEDVFALVILLIEEGLYDRSLIFVTASDEALLTKIRIGAFPLDRLAACEAAYRTFGGAAQLMDYCVKDAFVKDDCDGSGTGMQFSPALHGNLIWAQYNLATDRSFNEFQLIVGRRVLPELGAALRRRALQLFADSLSPFGILAVDPVDDLDAGAMALQFQPIERAHGLYRRSASTE